MNPNHPSWISTPQTKIISSSHTRLARVLSFGAILCHVATAWAAPIANKRVPAKSKSSTASAPTNLGNGIFILGEDAEPLQPTAARSSASSTEKRAYSKPATPTVRPNLNASLVHFCRSYLGRQLGNGQCSELAMLGLPAIGAQMDLRNQWGTPVCNYGTVNGRRTIQLGSAGYNRRNPLKPDIRPGDLIQYENVKFEQRWDGGYSVKSYPHHTSVIEQVSKDGNTIRVLEQNVNGTQFVVETVLYLPSQTEGTMRITRPMPR